MVLTQIEWDEGNWPKCAKHGVSKAEIEFVLMNTPMVMPDRSPASNEARYNAVGITMQKRHLFIVFTLRGKTILRPISARYMHDKEVKRYEQFQKS